MPSSKPSTTSAPNTASDFQAFADARGRPAIFVFSMMEPLTPSTVLELRSELRHKKFDEVDLVVNSGGGSIDAAYQIIELVRLHTETVNACVPFYAKSAATLICIGADTIALDELAQLGPLDTQIYEHEPGAQGDYVSALNPSKSLEELQSRAIETLDMVVGLMAVRSDMNLNQCLNHGIEFVRATSGPLFTQLKAEKLGEYSRALSIGQEYGRRLLRRYLGWSEENATSAIHELVYNYPSHEYIIDRHELTEMGFSVEVFGNSERDAVENLIYNHCTKRPTVIQCVEPSPAVATVKATAKASGNAP